MKIIVNTIRVGVLSQNSVAGTTPIALRAHKKVEAREFL